MLKTQSNNVKDILTWAAINNLAKLNMFHIVQQTRQLMNNVWLHHWRHLMPHTGVTGISHHGIVNPSMVSNTITCMVSETEDNLRRRMLFVAIPYAFFNRDDWEDLSRGLPWSETEVSQGERQRCTGADRVRAMLECVRYLEKLIPVPKKDSLARCERYSSGYSIESIMTSHRREDIADMPEDKEFNFQCDEGMDSGDVDLMTRIE
jgi:hypothetical protein